MGNPKNYPNGGSSLDPERDGLYEPKPEVLDFIFPSDAVYSMQVGDYTASSSGNHVRSLLTGMGFTPSLVDKVIEENGNENMDLLLEILVEKSKSSTQSSDSLVNLFDDKEEDGPAACSNMLPPPKEEPDVYTEVVDERKESLLRMNFTLSEVDFAINKLGDNASIGELVDFISAFQMARHADEGTHDMPQNLDQENKDDNDETLFGTMEKTLQLLDMGFSENDISRAIEKFAPVVIAAFLIHKCRTCPKSSPPVEIMRKKFVSNSLPRRYSYSNIEVMPEQFKHGLGRGRFGTVFKGTLLENGGFVAAK